MADVAMDTIAPGSELLPGYFREPTTGAWVTLPWPGDPSKPMTDPERLALLPPSLGPQIILWAEHWLVHHLTGEPLRLTPGQKRFLHLWYAVNPATGRWLYRSGVKRGAKGTGKDPIAAVVALAEFCGPVQWTGLNSQGRPQAKPRRMSKVQLAANSAPQAAEVLTVANGMISGRLEAKLRIDKGMTRTMLPSGSRLELLTASEKSTEGAPATAVILNESHHMTESSGGHKVAAVCRRNVGKSPATVQARMLEFTNAHQQGQDSVAERSFEAWQNQLAMNRVDILYDSIEADPGLSIIDPVQLRRGIEQAYHDCHWADVDRLLDEALDTRMSPADTVRFYLNGLAAAEEAWVDPANFDAAALPDEVVEPGEKIAMFLDCSKSTDATCLSACRLSDGHVISLGGWRRPHGARGETWLAPRETVDAVVREAMEIYNVVWFGVDPSPATDDATEALYWRPTIDKWHRDFQKKLPLWATPGAGGNSVLFDMRMSEPGSRHRNKLFTEAAMQTAIDIDEEKTLTHDGDPMLRQHVHNARRRPNQFGVSVGKVNRSSKHLVDYAITMIGARMGRKIALDRNIKAGKQKGARLLN